MSFPGQLWRNGALVAWKDATTHVATHALHYGTSVFEGIRSYRTDAGHAAVFRLRDHMERLLDSAQLIGMAVPFGVEELCQAVEQLLGATGLTDAYIRPLAYRGSGSLAVHSADTPVEVVILAYERDPRSERDVDAGIAAVTSTWRRLGPNTIPHTSKAGGAYLNAILAGAEARRGGADEAILLSELGFVADGSAQNLFVVKDGRLATPELSASILPGLTRDSLLVLAEEAGVSVTEQELIRADLYLAEEVFLTSTATEILPVRSVDGHELGVGPVTRRLRALFDDVVRGRRGHDEWLTPVREAVAGRD